MYVVVVFDDGMVVILEVDVNIFVFMDLYLLCWYDDDVVCNSGDMYRVVDVFCDNDVFRYVLESEIMEWGGWGWSREVDYVVLEVGEVVGGSSCRGGS